MPISLIVCPGDPRREGGVPRTRELPSLTFDGSHRVVIGRGSGCDLRLPDASVSHRHASLQPKGTDYVLVDEGSTNGTFVGGVRLAPRTSRALRSGDHIRIGRVWLEARIDHTPVTRDVANATRDLALALVSQAMLALGDDVTAQIRVVEGRDAGATLPLSDEGRVYLVGRGAHCDLALADEDASREHLAVARRGSAVFVRDLGAKNGVVMGEASLDTNRETIWRPAVVVRLGRTVLALDEPVSAALLELEQSPDEKLPTQGAPEPESAPPRPALASSPRSSAPATASAASSSSVSGAAAPIAAVHASDRRDGGRSRSPLRRRGWTVSDFIIMLAALSIFGFSIAGLVWLLRS